jgi:hypothetical protein
MIYKYYAPGFTTSYGVVFFVCSSEFRSEVVVCCVDVGGIVQ